MTAIEPLADPPQLPPTTSAPRTSRQVLAGVCGTILLIVAGVVTVGGAVVAVAAIAVAALIARRLSRRLSRGMSWLVAGVAVQLSVLGVGGYAAFKAPTGTFAAIQLAMDSTQANPSPPPAWLERIAPQASARARVARTAPPNPAFTKMTLFFSAIFTAGILGAMIGTVGWLVAFPLSYAVTGRWLGDAKGG